MKQTIIQQIKNGNNRIFFELYQNYRNLFIKSAMSRFRCPLEEAKDIFQDVMCIFHQNVMSGQLQELDVPIEQYLWKVANYRLINLKKRQKLGKGIENYMANNFQDKSDSITDNQSNYKLIQYLINKLSPKDQKILTLFYYNNYCTEAIAHELNYRNNQVVRNRKSKILKKIALDFQQLKKVQNYSSKKNLSINIST